VTLGYTTPDEIFQKGINDLIHDILGDSFVKVLIDEVLIKENIVANNSEIKCNIHLMTKNEVKTLQIENIATGIVDALFCEIVTQLSKNFYSLKNIEFVDFSIAVHFKEKIKKSGVDAPAKVSLIIKNSEQSRLYFDACSRSMNAGAIEVVRKAIEFLINAELAAIDLYDRITDAKERRRNDLVDQYTFNLIEIVKVTSYSTSIKKMSKKVLKP